MKKLLFVVFLVLVVFVSTVPVHDTEGSTEQMKLGDIFAKLAGGETLTAQEIDFIRVQMNDVQGTTAITGSWIAAGGNNIRANHIYAEDMDFGITPLSYFRSTRSDSYSILNNTLTYIPFTGYIDGKYIRIDPNNLDRIVFAFPQKSRAIFIIGNMAFASHATGRRSAGYEAFDASDVSQGGRTLFSVLPTGIDTDTYAFADPYLVPANVTYIKFTALQTSGGALNVEFYRVGIIIVK